ncbi:pre-mRNA-splicing factor CWC22 homolog isoform X3 [Cucurbita moschata]|uniref:Pre-mRNA-splicing factor CWC22 homolog isoform X3 n=1 Tax=Cucurbita moschata TaxID=3662 RepID=A0A6J1FKY7_CUCMO|nr:pre-mRNA-splicing factor CWC22 homolog isoform X3 [Cucurbita moschata]
MNVFSISCLSYLIYVCFDADVNLFCVLFTFLAQTMKRSRRKSRSSRKLKSMRYRHDSPSGSDNDSESSTSLSSSSTEDDEKVGRSRSKMRKNAKKRAKKRSHDRQRRDYSPHPRKRKHSKRDECCEMKKSNKKKRKRDASVRATSSDSLSCSTCGDGSTTSNEREIDRRKGRSRKRKENMGKIERSRYWSKSHSPCSLCSEGSDHQNEVENVCYVENNFRRLRSVIVVVGEEDKLETFDGNELQENVTHQPDHDHPSFGDINRNDGMSNRELDNLISEEAPVIITDNRNSIVVKDDGVQNEGSNNNHGGSTHDHPLYERKNGCSVNTDDTNCIDLESILRQRALENLRKYKRVLPRNVETPANYEVDNSNDAKQLDSPVSKLVHVTSPRDEAGINGHRFSRQGGGNAVNSMIIENGVKSTDEMDSAVASTYDPVYSSQHLALKPESNVDSLTEQASASQESIQTKPSKSDMGDGETTQTQTQMRNNDVQNIGDGFGSSAHKPSSSSSLNSISGESLLNDSRHESGEGSQFEQKTMSVKRGGEMVQVNYKVYIPKRAPGLSRRQLKR